ncbi:MAG: hypothetical protein K2N51_06215 [Lachnospiraceae bacterium]|nr:hypothetical protein [Lachnospiraceae bacterium]
MAQYKEMVFEKTEPKDYHTLRNQGDELRDYTEEDILEFLEIIMEDTDEFVTLTSENLISEIRYVQAAVNDGEITLQIGIEKEDGTHLCEKEVTYEKCKEIFLDFHNGIWNENIDDFGPTLFC